MEYYTRKLELGLCERCGQSFLKFLNIIFMLLGIGFAIVGVVMRIKSPTYDKEEVRTLFNKIVFNGTLLLGNVLSYISYLTLALGGLIMIFGAISICCIRRKNRCLLVTYAFLMLLVFVTQSVTVGMWSVLAYKVDYQIQSDLTNLLSEYAGVNYANSTGWNLMFLRMECCGVDAISSSSNSDEFANSRWWDSRSSTLDKVPQSCCQQATEENYKTYSSDTNCQRTLKTHYSQGCYEAIKDWLYQYQTAAIVIGSFLIFTEILALTFALIACRTLSIKAWIT